MMFRILSTTVLFLLTAHTSASATNFYVGINLGATAQSGDFTLIDSSLNPSVGIDTLKDYQAPDDTAGSISLFAGYKLGSDFFLEVTYAQNTEIESPLRTLNSGNAGIETSETSYTSVAFVGLWPVDNNWALSARLGFSAWDIDYSQTEVDTALLATDPGYITQEQFLSDNTSAMLLGFGISYGFSENLELKFNIENHFVDFAFTNLELDYDALTYTFGTAYHF
ncbi:MAG: outer membrane beta-barrel protein [Gammaproteobacteria bacterium]|nr:outer membrane beta-barrel protein [Gammaproteobacteria bacterium]